MPQLDNSTFFTQTFWLIATFIFLYIIITCYFIPTIATIIKFRIKYSYYNKHNNSLFKKEIDRFNALVMNHSKKSKKLINTLINDLNNWFNSEITSINTITLKQPYNNLIINRILLLINVR